MELCVIMSKPKFRILSGFYILGYMHAMIVYSIYVIMYIYIYTLNYIHIHMSSCIFPKSWNRLAPGHWAAVEPLGTDQLPGRNHHDRTQKRLCGAHLQWTLADRGGSKWRKLRGEKSAARNEALKKRKVKKVNWKWKWQECADIIDRCDVGLKIG